MGKPNRRIRGGVIAIAIGLVCGFGSLIGNLAHADENTPYTVYIDIDDTDKEDYRDKSTTHYETCKDTSSGQVCEVTLTAKQWHDVLVSEGLPTEETNGQPPATVEDLEAYLKVLQNTSAEKDPVNASSWARDMLLLTQDSAPKRLNKRFFNAFADNATKQELNRKKEKLDKYKDELLKAKDEAKSQELKDKIDKEIAKIDATEDTLTLENAKDDVKGPEIKKNMSEIVDEVAKLKEEVERDKNGETTPEPPAPKPGPEPEPEPAPPAPAEDNGDLEAAKAKLQESVDEAGTVSEDADLPKDAKDELDAAIAKAKAAKDDPDATVDSVNAAKDELDAAIAKAKKAIEDKKASDLEAAKEAGNTVLPGTGVGLDPFAAFGAFGIALLGAGLVLKRKINS